LLALIYEGEGKVSCVSCAAFKVVFLDVKLMTILAGFYL